MYRLAGRNVGADARMALKLVLENPRTFTDKVVDTFGRVFSNP